MEYQTNDCHYTEKQPSGCENYINTTIKKEKEFRNKMCKIVYNERNVWQSV